MMKTLAFLIAPLFYASVVDAKSSSHQLPSQNAAGIVTPDVARGVRSFYMYNSDTNGNMVVCLEEDRGMGGSCKKWKLLEDVIPKGTTYVGFRISRLSGGSYIEIYWK